MSQEQSLIHNYHVIQGGDSEYLFDPLTLELYKLNGEQAAALRNIENNSSACFRLDHEGTALEFANIDYDPCYEVNILLTADCNLHCAYCFADETYRSTQELDPMVGTEFLRGLMHHFKLKFVKFFGGEPLLKFEKLKTIVAELVVGCKAAGQPLPNFGVVSNGLLLKPKVMSYLRDYGFLVTISCDGINVPDEILRLRYPNSDLADLVVENIAKALNRGLRVSVQATYTKNHVQAGISPIDLLEGFRSIGVECVHIMPAFNSLSNLSPTQLKWVKEGFKQAAAESIVSVIGEYPILLVYVLKIISRLLRITEGYFICGAGIDSLTLMPSGKVYPCYLLNDRMLEIGDASSESFESMLPRIHKTRAMFVERRKTQIDECARCWARTICASCFGPRFQTDCSLGAPDQPFCETLRATIEGCLIALAEIRADSVRWQRFLIRFEDILSSSGQPILSLRQSNKKERR